MIVIRFILSLVPANVGNLAERRSISNPYSVISIQSSSTRGRLLGLRNANSLCVGVEYGLSIPKKYLQSPPGRELKEIRELEETSSFNSLSSFSSAFVVTKKEEHEHAWAT
jgi:hypothetical protein